MARRVKGRFAERSGDDAVNLSCQRQIGCPDNGLKCGFAGAGIHTAGRQIKHIVATRTNANAFSLAQHRWPTV